MLRTKKKIAIYGESIVDGVSVANISVEIDCENPNIIHFNTSQGDANLYKANRSQAHVDFAEFEDMAYALQEEMLAGVDIDTDQTEVPVEEPEETY